MKYREYVLSLLPSEEDIEIMTHHGRADADPTAADLAAIEAERPGIAS